MSDLQRRSPRRRGRFDRASSAVARRRGRRARGSGATGAVGTGVIRWETSPRGGVRERIVASGVGHARANRDALHSSHAPPSRERPRGFRRRSRSVGLGADQAGTVIRGIVRPSGDSVELRADVVDRPTGADCSQRCDSASECGDDRSARLEAFADRVTAAVATALYPGWGTALSQPASYAGYRTFLEGMRSIKRERHDLAVAAFRRAYGEDSTFTAAGLLAAMESIRCANTWRPIRSRPRSPRGARLLPPVDGHLLDWLQRSLGGDRIGRANGHGSRRRAGADGGPGVAPARDRQRRDGSARGRRWPRSTASIPRASSARAGSRTGRRASRRCTSPAITRGSWPSSETRSAAILSCASSSAMSCVRSRRLAAWRRSSESVATLGATPAPMDSIHAHGASPGGAGARGARQRRGGAASAR